MPACYLLSNRAAFITGTELLVDGGRMAILQMPWKERAPPSMVCMKNRQGIIWTSMRKDYQKSAIPIATRRLAAGTLTIAENDLLFLLSECPTSRREYVVSIIQIDLCNCLQLCLLRYPFARSSTDADQNQIQVWTTPDQLLEEPLPSFTSLVSGSREIIYEHDIIVRGQLQ